MAKVSGAQQLDDLYNQLLNSFDNDGPDLNLVSPTQTPPPVPPPPPAAPTMPPPNLNHSQVGQYASKPVVVRSATTDSNDKLLDLYQSYVDDRESGRDTPDRSLPPPNQRGLNVSTTPGSMYPNISPNGTTTLPAADSYFSSQTSPSSGRSRPLPPPPGAAPPRMSSSPNGFVAPPPPPPLHSVPSHATSSSTDSTSSYYRPPPAPSPFQDPALSHSAEFSSGSGSRVTAQRALSHGGIMTKRDFPVYTPHQNGGSGMYDTTGSTTNGIPRQDSASPPPPLPAKPPQSDPRLQHAASFSVGSTGTTTDSMSMSGDTTSLSHRSSHSVVVTSPSSFTMSEEDREYRDKEYFAASQQGRNTGYPVEKPTAIDTGAVTPNSMGSLGYSSSTSSSPSGVPHRTPSGTAIPSDNASSLHSRQSYQSHSSSSHAPNQSRFDTSSSSGASSMAHPHSRTPSSPSLSQAMSMSMTMTGPTTPTSTTQHHQHQRGQSFSQQSRHHPRPSMSQSTYSASHEQYDYVDPDDFPDGAGFSDDEEDIGEDDFFNSSLLSNVAVKLRDKVPRETHVKGSIPFEGAFTGKDIVSTIQSIIQRDIPDIASDGRRTALAIARSLHAQLFFNEVEWEFRELTDGVEDLYRFMDDMLGASGSGGGNPFLEDGEREELPNGIITPLTRCYVSTCGENDLPCYAWSCPRRVGAHANVPSAFGVASGGRLGLAAGAHGGAHGGIGGRGGARRITAVPPGAAGLFDGEDDGVDDRAWANGIDPAILATVGRSEINRQTIIHKTILQEAKYLKDLDLIDTLFVKPLRRTQPPIIPLPELDAFIDTVFGNILDLRETNKRILEKLYVRQREQGPFIEYIGDIFLTAATEFRVVYPKYVGNLVRAGQRVQEELDGNARFRAFHDECLTVPEARGLSLPQLITHPSEHLQKYPVLLEAIRNETAEGNHDAEYLIEASEAIKKLSTMAQLRAFQVNMLRGGAAGDKEWHMLVANDVREALPKAEVKRQQAIFELIKSEMAYVRDLEAFQMLFIRPLRAARLPLADPTERGVDDFLRDIFHNYQEILEHQRRLLNAFFEIQSEEYPCVDSIVAPIMDAALNWGDAYMEYTTHYPIAEYRIDEANAMPEFRTVVQEAQRNPEANKLDIKSFINRPVSRILRYVLLLKRILGETPKTHPDQASIPEVVEMLEKLSSALNYAIEAPKKKVQMWKYHHNLVWKPGEEMNLDLLDDTRQLLHTGRLLRQPESGFELGGWSELFVLLFDNYLVMTKAKEKDGVIKYHVNRRPIPLELLTLLSFNEAPIQRSTSLLSNLRGGRSTNAAAAAAYAPMEQGPADHRLVFPCSVYHSARVGGHYLIFAESDQARAEWKDKLEEAINIRKVVLENNKAFEVNTISKDTFVIPMQMATSPQTWNDSAFTGKVTCSIPLRAANGRDLVAVGCAEGVWIGLRNDAASLRRVLHLKNVTQCAMLEDFGIFLVLADKYLFAYHIEALVPTGPAGSAPPREPQRLNKNRDVQFFSVGTLNDRTLIIYMKKKGLDSVFRVLEPVTEKIAEKSKTSNFSRTIFGSQKSEWFREYKEFFLPSEAYDLIFLKVKVAILCAKGFEIMDLVEFNSVTIPQRDDPRHAAIAKRSESRRPMGMFRSAENEFLLCYDEFGLYVDRHGDATPRQVGVIEWEGTAERVAFHPPYVVIFDSRFIEIRHIANGKLVQIIQGSDIHCTWDGRGYLSRSNTSIYPNTPGPSGWDENSGAIDARIHAVMKADNGPSVHRNTISQHVFELAPTQLLYAPPPSASHQSQNPTSANYFQTGTAISPRPSSVGTGWSR